MTNQQTPLFYVYQYIDPRPDKNQAVIYVGKGTHKGGKLHRMESHWEAGELKNLIFGRVLAKIRGLGLEPVRVVVSWHETERDALAAEVVNIALHGLLRNGGTLCNLTLGGEGTSGFVHDEDALRKIQAASKAFWQNHDYVARRRASMVEYIASHRAEIQARSEKIRLSWTQEKRKDHAEGVRSRGPDYAEKCSAAMTAERKTKQVFVAKKHLQTEDVIARRKVTLKHTMSTSEFRAELSARTKAALAKPGAKANQKAASKKMWEDPAHREKMLAVRAQQVTDETRAKLSASTKLAVANQSEETKAKLSAFRSEMTRARHARVKLEKINALDLGPLASLCG